MAKYNTITISELIKSLEEIKEEEGDLPVAIASDEEGNNFGTLSSNFIEMCVSIEDGILAIYPAIDHLDLDEINNGDEIDYMISSARRNKTMYYDEDTDKDIMEEDIEDEIDEDDPPYGCFSDDDE